MGPAQPTNRLENLSRPQLPLRGVPPELESEAQIRGSTECRAESKKADTGRLLVNIWQTVRRNGDAKGLKYDYCTNCGYCIWWAYDDGG